MPDIDDLDIGNEEADEVLLHPSSVPCACTYRASSMQSGRLR